MPERSESGNRGGTFVRFVELVEESHAQLGNRQRVTASLTVAFIVDLPHHSRGGRSSNRGWECQHEKYGSRHQPLEMPLSWEQAGGQY